MGEPQVFEIFFWLEREVIDADCGRDEFTEASSLRSGKENVLHHFLLNW